jgi:hypothetical protein
LAARGSGAWAARQLKPWEGQSQRGGELRFLSMAQRKQANENAGKSVQQSAGVTTGRKRQERRLASGNVRRGQVASENEINRSVASRTRSAKRSAHR